MSNLALKNDISESIKYNQRNKIDGLTLLSTIENEFIKTAFFDPQYRGVMDKMNYGNEGARQKARALLSQMSEETIINFIEEIDRVLLKSGYLFLWVDKFHLCEGIHSWIKNTNLEIVDLITWNKLSFGMGYRTRRVSEYLLVLQKKPKLAKATWTIHNIRDVWDEKASSKDHPHSKPINLQKILIEATSKEGDFILDPASGSYSVMQSALESNRNFIGGDLI